VLLVIDVMSAIVLAVVIGLAALYLYRTKKSGAKCVGCPCAKECSGKCGENQKM